MDVTLLDKKIDQMMLELGFKCARGLTSGRADSGGGRQMYQQWSMEECLGL